MAKALEYAAGRRRGARHAARPLDVDLLLHGDAIQSCPELRLPHPALLERRFVLQPLADLEPDLEVPTTRRTVRELLAALPPSPEAEYLGPW